MWLAIDIGNTNIHIGMFEGDKLHSVHSIKIEFAHTLQTNFVKILNPLDRNQIHAVILSSVNPKAEILVVQYIQGYLAIPPKIIGKDIPVPVPVMTEYPERVGMDRLVNALAAFERTKNWTIIADAGTAITIDVVNNEGAFIGGIIAPGMDMSSRALHHYTALLPEISVRKPKGILGKNTEDAINSGIYWGTIGMVSRLVNMLCDELKCRPAVIATGGNADVLAKEIPLITDVLPYLTLEGIRIAHKANLALNMQR